MDVMSSNTLLAAATISSGLVSGLLYGWTVSVIPGLKKVPDTAYVETMQHINRAIIKPRLRHPIHGATRAPRRSSDRPVPGR